MRRHEIDSIAKAAIVVMLTSAVMALVLLPPQQPRVHSMRTACLSNLKQTALATLLYAQDYDDKFMSGENWEGRLLPYIKNELRCPSAPQGSRGHAYNGLVEQAPTSTPGAEKIPLFYDSSKLERSATDYLFSSFVRRRHERPDGRGGLVAYADSHVKAPKPDEHVGPMFPPRGAAPAGRR